MPKKKSVALASKRFIELAEKLDEYYVAVSEGTDLTNQEVTWTCEAAIIKLNAYFEHLMLNALVGAINNDTTLLTPPTGVKFPTHLTDEVCEYIVTGGRYFDFRGRDGLLKVLQAYVPKTHYLVRIVGRKKYQDSLDKMIALRNFAAHESSQGKKRAKELVGKLTASGVWLKKHNRFLDISHDLKELAKELGQAAPY
jgi:hypothetical protein